MQFVSAHRPVLCFGLGTGKVIIPSILGIDEGCTSFQLRHRRQLCLICAYKHSLFTQRSVDLRCTILCYKTFKLRSLPYPIPTQTLLIHRDQHATPRHEVARGCCQQRGERTTLIVSLRPTAQHMDPLSANACVSQFVVHRMEDSKREKN